MHAKLPQSCPTLCLPQYCSPLGASVHGILQARILECLVMPFSRIFVTQGLNPCLLPLLDWQAGSLPLNHLGPRFFPPTSGLSFKVGRSSHFHSPHYDLTFSAALCEAQEHCVSFGCLVSVPQGDSCLPFFRGALGP